MPIGIYKEKQFDKRVLPFRLLSEGAKAFLGLVDSTNSETGFYEGMAAKDARKCNTFYIENYYTGAAELLADKDFQELSALIEAGEDVHDFKNSLLDKEVLKVIESEYDFDLTEITADEWDMIVERYVNTINQLRIRDLEIQSQLSGVVSRNEKTFKKIEHVNEAYQELKLTLTESTQEKKSWDDVFEQINKRIPTNAIDKS